jgi:hypothetical protein
LFFFCKYFILYISFIAGTVYVLFPYSLVVVVVVVYLQDLGQNFIDPIPADDLPSRLKAQENLARAS